MLKDRTTWPGCQNSLPHALVCVPSQDMSQTPCENSEFFFYVPFALNGWSNNMLLSLINCIMPGFTEVLYYVSVNSY